MINGNNKVARQLIFSPATLTVALLLVVALLDSFLLPFCYLFVELHVNKNHSKPFSAANHPVSAGAEGCISHDYSAASHMVQSSWVSLAFCLQNTWIYCLRWTSVRIKYILVFLADQVCKVSLKHLCFELPCAMFVLCMFAQHEIHSLEVSCPPESHTNQNIWYTHTRQAKNEILSSRKLPQKGAVSVHTHQDGDHTAK